MIYECELKFNGILFYFISCSSLSNSFELKNSLRFMNIFRDLFCKIQLHDIRNIYLQSKISCIFAQKVQ